jgi:hypothetical protein
MKVHNLLVTGSLTSGGENIGSISSSVATTNNVQDGRLNSIESITGSLVSKTGSFATTGSNIFIGTQTVSGSIIPAVDNAYDLGSVTHQFRDLYLSSASLYIDGTKVLSSTTQELQITTDAGQSFKILEAGSDTITLQSGDGNITLASSGGGDVIMDPTNGIIALKGTTTLYAGNRILSSDGNAIQFGNSVTMTGSLVVTGFIETQELRTTYISSSILFRSGSTKFGDELDDTHSFTGSLSVSGSISVPGSGLVSGSSQITYSGLNGIPSGIVSGSAQLPSGIVSSSAQTIANLPSGTVSGSVQVDVMSTTNIARLATTGSNTFSGNIRTTGLSIGVAATSNILDIRGENNTFDGTIVLGARGTIQHRDSGQTILSIANDYNDNAAKFEIRMKGNTTSDAKFTILGSGAATFTSSLTAESGYFNKPSATNGTSLIVRQTTAGGNGNQDIGLVVDIQGANDLDRILNLRYYNGSTFTSRFSVLRDGKVGVGYLTPTVPLQVSGTIASGDGDNGWGRFFYDTNVVKIQASKNGTDAIGLSFWTQASGGGFSEKLNISGAGDSVFTGTGTFSGGGNTLTLKKGTGSPAIAFAGTSNEATALVEGITGGGVRFYTSSGTLSSPSWSTKLFITHSEGIKFGANVVSIIGTEGSHGYHYLYSSGTPKIYIEANGVVALLNPGGVAIGKSSASSALDVQAAGAAGIVLSADSTDTNNSGRLFFMRTGGEGWAIFNNAQKLSFRNGSIPGNTSGTERMYLDSSGNLLPGADATYNLGSTGLRWNNLYTTDLHLSNEGKQNVVDGTWGDWTLQEGENDIFMLNNRSGEKFKIKLEKIV